VQISQGTMFHGAIQKIKVAHFYRSQCRR